ncbi:MAG: hypothetical protein L6E13_05780 [Firmicutes bacterium]|nr:hypothetical protein [Bacillota bacterium]
MAERFPVHAYKCVDCDRAFFALERYLPHRCPFCQCPSVVRLKDRAEVTIWPVQPAGEQGEEKG